MAHKTRESPCDAHGTLGGDAGGWSVVVETGIELMRACLCSVGKSSECGHAWQRGDSRTTAPRRPPRAWRLQQSHALCRLGEIAPAIRALVLSTTGARRSEWGRRIQVANRKTDDAVRQRDG